MLTRRGSTNETAQRRRGTIRRKRWNKASNGPERRTTRPDLEGAARDDYPLRPPVNPIEKDALLGELARQVVEAARTESAATGRPCRLRDGDALSRFLAALAAGSSQTRAANEAGLSEAVVRLWLKRQDGDVYGLFRHAVAEVLARRAARRFPQFCTSCATCRRAIDHHSPGNLSACAFACTLSRDPGSHRPSATLVEPVDGDAGPRAIGQSPGERGSPRASAECDCRDVGLWFGTPPTQPEP